MANFVEGFKDFVAKPEGKAALGAAAAFIGYSWWKNRKGNASAAAVPAPASDTPAAAVTMPSYIYGPSTSSLDGSHDGGGVATTPITGTTGVIATPIIGGGNPPVIKPPVPSPSGGGSSPQYVTVTKWSANGTSWSSTLSGIAAHFGMTLAALLALPGNAQYRSNPGLIYAGNQVQVA